jgi:hypothetical protein
MPKCFVIFCLLLSFRVSSQEVPDALPITLDVSQKTIEEILFLIKPQTNLQIFYTPQYLSNRKLDFKVKDLPLNTALKELFSGSSLDFQLYREYALIIGPADQLKANYSQEYFKALQTGDDAGKPVSRKIKILGSREALASNGKAVLRGEVIQQKDKSPIIGATIKAVGTSYGTVTDESGKYSMELTPGKYTLLVQYIGNEDLEEEIQIYSSASLRLVMEAGSINLKEVTIGAQAVDANVKAVQISATTLNLKSIRKLPVFLGETDIIKSLLMTPGVSSLGEGATGFNVRGGEVDQNLILQDDGLVFNSSHALGFFSAFNPDIIQSVNLYKSILPASFGGRLASALDIETRDGDFTAYKFKAGIGLVSGRLSIEGPIWKNKTSILAGFRSSYSDWILRQARNIEVKNSSAFFYDLNLKLSHRFNSKNSLNLSLYSTNDDFNYNKSFGFDYQTNNMELVYKKIFSGAIYNNLAITQGTYTSTQTDFTGVDASTLDNRVQHYQLKNTIDIKSKNEYHHQIGFQSILYQVDPGSRLPYGPVSGTIPKTVEAEKGLESALFWSIEKTVGIVQLAGGLRWSHYAFLGPKTIYNYSSPAPFLVENMEGTTAYGSGKIIKTYHTFEPRISARIGLSETSSFKAGYGRNAQYINQIFNSDSPTPTSQYQLSTPYLEPTKAHNVSIGYFQNFKNNLWESSIEVYGRAIDVLYDYKDFADLYVNDHVETELLFGIGRAYGAELSIKKTKGTLNGTLGYTLSRTERKIEGISKGNWYPSNFDKPHQFAIVLNHQYNQRHTLSINFVYSTGRPTTAPQGYYRTIQGVAIPIYSSRNWLRIPDYHRMDIAYTFGQGYKKKHKIKSSWTVSIYNLYGRRNAFSVFFTQTPFTGGQANKLAILGTVFPSITLNLEMQ